MECVGGRKLLAVFAYSGVSSRTGAVRGTVAADTPRQARDQLRSDGILVQKLTEYSDQGGAIQLLQAVRYRGARQQWAMGVHELSMLLHAGTPMLEALDTLADQSRGPFRDVMLRVRDRVAAGSSLADAMGQHPELFDEASVHLIEVGENAGTLDDVLAQLAEFKQRMLQVKDQVLTALMYPAFLVVFGLAAAIFLMTSVLPPLLNNLQDQIDSIPWPTQVVRSVSDVLVNYGLWLLLGGMALVVSAALYLRTEHGRRRWHRLLLRLPLIGSMALKQAVARVAMIVSTLSKSGVVLTRAIELAAQSTENLVLRDALVECGERIGAGEEVAVALGKAGVFPPLAVRVFAVGQESGRLEEMLMRLAEDYERQNATASARLTSLLEPALILVLAAFVGFLLLATILPILEAGNVVR